MPARRREPRDLDASAADGGTTVQKSSRWAFVGSVGVACGALLAWLFWSLTGGAIAALVIGVATASILVVLAVAGGRYNSTYQVTADRRAEALAKRERVRRAIEETHRPK